MSTEATRDVMERYWDGDDPSAIADDAVYTFMPTGERFVGPDAILAMMRSFYGETLAGTPEGVERQVGDGWAVLESTLVGTHVGTLAGVEATGAKVRVPMCVVYRVADAAIRSVNVYFMLNVALEQIRDA
ncbi:MAG: hypothetical protein EA416_03865 [Trueperaceae bacterium]|nr:MAG: hypothetical protein EA416_03865 [Trueperaceae bacterium]